MEAVKWKPDVIVLDYADLMFPNGKQFNDNSYEEKGTIYEQLRGASAETDVPIWTVSQTRRSGIEEWVITAEHIAESWKKVMTADFVGSLSRTDSDKLMDTARLHAIKSRFGPDAITFPARMSTSAGTIELLDPKSEEGKKAMVQSKQQSEAHKKQQISQEWQKFKMNGSNKKPQIDNDWGLPNDDSVDAADEPEQSVQDDGWEDMF
jgi:hypothetical protein